MEENEKQILLALGFAKAPKELQEAATAYGTILKLISKHKLKIATTSLELQEAEKQAGEIAKNYRSQLRKWIPEV